MFVSIGATLWAGHNQMNYLEVLEQLFELPPLHKFNMHCVDPPQQ